MTWRSTPVDVLGQPARAAPPSSGTTVPTRTWYRIESSLGAASGFGDQPIGTLVDSERRSPATFGHSTTSSTSDTPGL